MRPTKLPPGALHGLVVLDLTQMLAGPYASMMLADQGARVIKIEPPGGDMTRRTGPHLAGALTMEQRGYGAYFNSVNRNKESLVLDLKQEAGRRALLRLVLDADVLMENYRAGVMERLGLSYEVLAQVNPRLVYAALRGFGDPRGGAHAVIGVRTGLIEQPAVEDERAWAVARLPLFVCAGRDCWQIAGVCGQHAIVEGAVAVAGGGAQDRADRQGRAAGNLRNKRSA